MACASTLLNHLKKLSIPTATAPRIMGVDDFAFRKGQRYGTILVDLERNQLVQNLEETLEKVFSSYGAQLKAVEQQQRQTLVEVGTETAIDPQVSPLTKSRAAFLILKRVEHRDAEDTKLINGIVSQHPALALAVDLADEFLQLLRQQRADVFDDWLLKALQSSLKPFVQFAEGLFEDYAAVKAKKLGRTQTP